MSTLKLQILLGAVDKLTAPLKAVTGQSRITAKDLADTKAKVRDLEKQSGQIDGYRTLGKQIGATRAELSAAQQTAQRMAKQLAATSTPTKAMTRDLEKAKGAVRDLTNKEREMVSRHGAMKTAMQQAGINTSQLSQHQRQLKTDLAATTAQLEQQRSKLAQVAAQQKRLAQVKANYDKTMAMRGTLAGYGAAGMATGAAGLYKINSIASVGLDFDAQMSKVQALTRLQKGSAELAMLRQQARDLGASTSFTAMDAAGGQGFLAMAGFTPQNIKAAMPGILDMAKAGGMEIARTADIASNILSGFQLPATEMGRVGDSLVATFTRSNTSLEMLGETMKYAAPIAAGLGVDMETVSAMAGKLGDAGVQGSMAGTGISAILTRLVKPTKEVRGALDALGVKAKDATGKLRDPLDLLEDIERKTSKMADGGVAYLAAISGQEALKAMIPLVAASKKGADSVRALRDSVYGATGEAAEVARVMADNARGDIDGLTSAWQDLNIELMTSQNGPLRGLIQQITAMTRGVGEWMRKNPELTATLTKVAAITAVTAAVGGGLLLVLAGLLGPIAAIKMGLGMMLTMGGPLLILLKGLSLGFLKLGVAILTTPIGWIIAGIAAVAVGAYLIYKNWDQLGPWFKSTWSKCKAATGEFLDYLKELPEKGLKMGRDIVSNIMDGITEKWKDLMAQVKSLTKYLPDWFTGGGVTIEQEGASGPSYLSGNKSGGLALAGASGYGPRIVETPKIKPAANRTVVHQPFYQLDVHPAPGMDESRFAKMTMDLIKEHDRANQRAGRASYRDGS